MKVKNEDRREDKGGKSQFITVNEFKFCLMKGYQKTLHLKLQTDSRKQSHLEWLCYWKLSNQASLQQHFKWKASSQQVYLIWTTTQLLLVEFSIRCCEAFVFNSSNKHIYTVIPFISKTNKDHYPNPEQEKICKQISITNLDYNGETWQVESVWRLANVTWW